MKDKKALKNKIMKDEDFIYCPRLRNSLKTLIEKNSNGVNDERIKKVLLMSQEELNLWYNSALDKLRKALKLGD